MIFNKKNITPLLSGLAFGIVIGAGFVLVKYDLLFFSKAAETEKSVVVLSDNNADNKIKTTKIGTPKNQTIAALTDYPPDTLNSYAFADSLFTDADTLYASAYDTVYFTDFNETDYDFFDNYHTGSDIVVLRDRLIKTTELKADMCKESEVRQTENLDSLLIRGHSVQYTPGIYYVEFWESPLNYRGYKKSKDKLVLYGIKQYDFASLKVLNNDLYLKYLDVYYRIDETIQFRNLVPLNNDNLIKKLEQL